MPASRGPGGSRTSSRISTKLSVASNSPSRRQGPRPGRQLPSLPAAASCASLALVVFFFISLHAPPLSSRSGGSPGQTRHPFRRGGSCRVTATQRHQDPGFLAPSPELLPVAQAAWRVRGQPSVASSCPRISNSECSLAAMLLEPQGQLSWEAPCLPAVPKV